MRRRGVFATVVGVAKSAEGNARSRDAVSRGHKLTRCTCCRVVYLLSFVLEAGNTKFRPVRKGLSSGTQIPKKDRDKCRQPQVLF